MATNQSVLRPFLAGAVTAMTLSYVVSKMRLQKRKQVTFRKTRRNSVLMDSPDLDQRMIRKAEGAIRKRTSRLVVVIERCTNDFNYSAILRTVEALGIQHVYLIAPPVLEKSSNVLYNMMGQVVKRASANEISQRNQHALFAQGAAEWLSIHEFQTTRACMDRLKELRYTIWATDLSQQAVCLDRDGLHAASEKQLLPDKLAIVFGTESVGCTQEMLEGADLRVYLSLVGFADSLNLSVATALVIQQLFHLDPTIRGGMSETERQELRKAWFAKLASRRLLTSREKKHRTRLIAQINACEELLEKQQAYQQQQESNKEGKDAIDEPLIHPLEPNQVEKLNKLPRLQQELEEMDDELKHKASLAVQDLVKNPPPPLDDMRRADPHRICFVGRNTKSKNKGLWKDMPATSKYHTNQSSATYFRDLVEEKNDTE